MNTRKINFDNPQDIFDNLDELTLQARRARAEAIGELAGIIAAKIVGLAGKLAAGPTEALGAVKKLLLMSANDSLESQMERETRSIASLGASADGREGIDAFVNKRKPTFAGK